MDKRFAEGLAAGDLGDFRDKAQATLNRLEATRQESLRRYLADLTKPEPKRIGQANEEFTATVDQALSPFTLWHEVWREGGHWFLPFPDPRVDRPFLLTFLRISLQCPWLPEEAVEYPDLILTYEPWPIYLHRHTLQRLRQRIVGADRRALERLLTGMALLYCPINTTMKALELEQIGIGLTEDCLIMGSVEGGGPEPSIWVRTCLHTEELTDRNAALHRSTLAWLDETANSNLNFLEEEWSTWAFPALDDGWEELADRLSAAEFAWLKQPYQNRKFDERFVHETRRLLAEPVRFDNVIPFPRREQWPDA